MAEKKKSIHTGHRGRVKEEFLARGIEGWPDHRVLELMLFFALPQGDTNPLAHELIDRFGSLDRVLDALPEELMKTPGLGTHAATFLKLFPAVLSRYLAGRAGPGHIIHTVEEAGQVLAPYFYGARNEMAYLLCLDSKEKLLAVRKLSEGNLYGADITIRRAAEECMALQATYCYLAHNHASGIAQPSPRAGAPGRAGCGSSGLFRRRHGVHPPDQAVGAEGGLPYEAARNMVKNLFDTP